MTRKVFFFKYLLPFVTVVSLWLCIASYIDSQFGVDDLVKVQGKLVSVHRVSSSSRSNYVGNLLLQLDNGKEYILTSEWNDQFAEVEKHAKEDEVVEIFHRTPNQTLFRFGKSNMIYQLKIGKDMILDIEKRQEESKHTSVVNLLFVVVGVLAILYYREKKKVQLNSK